MNENQNQIIARVLEKRNHKHFVCATCKFKYRYAILTALSTTIYISRKVQGAVFNVRKKSNRNRKHQTFSTCHLNVFTAKLLPKNIVNETGCLNV